MFFSLFMVQTLYRCLSIAWNSRIMNECNVVACTLLALTWLLYGNFSGLSLLWWLHWIRIKKGHKVKTGQVNDFLLLGVKMSIWLTMEKGDWQSLNLRGKAKVSPSWMHELIRKQRTAEELGCGVSTVSYAIIAIVLLLLCFWMAEKG